MSYRILLVSNFFPPRTVGGAEIVAFRQARALAARGHGVTVLAGDLPTESARAGTLSFDLHEGLPIYRLALRSLDPDENFYWSAAARRMKSIIAADCIEIVHFHNVMGLGANLILAAKGAGALCLVTLHDHWGFCFRQTRLRPDGSLCNNFDECAGCLSAIQPPGGTALPMRLRRDYVAWCLGRADFLITPSAYLATAYAKAGFARERIGVVSNGIDLAVVPDQAKDPAPDGVMRFLCSAYLGEHKGILVLLEAMKRLARDSTLSSRWHVTIAGEGHLRPALEKAVNTDGLSRNVSLVGRVPRPELLALMSKTDVSVLASIWPENEPVSMLEAIASGSAQIATRTGGNVELVEDLQSGFLVKPGDPEELAEAMRKYIVEPALAAQHGAYNRKRRREFDETNTIHRLEEIMAAKQQPAVDRSVGEPVIICGTGWPPLEASALTSRAHEHLGDGPAPRFIWHEWADARVWRDAALLWLWDRHPEEWLVNAALRRGVPILAPANQWAEGLARHYGGVILYRTYLEALAAMRSVLSIPALHAEFAWRSRAASASAAVMAPTTAFGLNSETAP
jgi:glycosyltransferase involved in cell wall biosynthesis